MEPRVMNELEKHLRIFVIGWCIGSSLALLALAVFLLWIWLR